VVVAAPVGPGPDPAEVDDVVEPVPVVVDDPDGPVVDDPVELDEVVEPVGPVDGSVVVLPGLVEVVVGRCVVGVVAVVATITRVGAGERTSR
jgi:hypothetical protein